MRSLMLAMALTAMFGGTGALAQSSSAYPYCLMTGPAQDCTYSSLAQCQASKRGNADFCEPNNWYSGSNHSRARQ
jgi:Protein of unknown function (DUF3551)